MEYKKGKENRVADALSRVKHALLALGSSTAIPTWITEVVNSYKDDAKCSELITKLAIDPTGHPLIHLLVEYSDSREKLLLAITLN